MTHLFLKAKPWQLFIAIILLPFICSIYLDNTNQQSAIIDILNYVVVLISSTILLLWIQSINYTFIKLVPKEIKMNKNRFKFTYLYCVIYIPFLLFGTAIYSHFQPSESIEILVFVILFFLHFIMMLSVIYCLFFIAHLVKYLELKKQLQLSDYIIEGMLLIIFPIGIWVLQPRIKKIYEELQKP